ncbi:MAG TPA: hypothetical protein VK607_07895, partial [Kofleriaceae bacterium]|nr:hypothetical protein [Kofleriaceae bacterium]
ARWSKTQTIDRPDDVTARTATWELVGHRGDVLEIRGTTSDSGSQYSAVSTSSHGEFSSTTDLATLGKSGHGLLRGEYRVRYGGELHVIEGGTEAVQQFRPARAAGHLAH